MTEYRRQRSRRAKETKRILRKAISIFISIALILLLVPAAVFAEGEAPPSNLHTTFVDEMNFSVAWSGVSWADYYMVYAQCTSGDNADMQIKRTDTTCYFGALAPGSSYKVHVDAHSNNLVMTSN